MAKFLLGARYQTEIYALKFLIEDIREWRQKRVETFYDPGHYNHGQHQCRVTTVFSPSRFNRTYQSNTSGHAHSFPRWPLSAPIVLLLTKTITSAMNWRHQSFAHGIVGTRGFKSSSHNVVVVYCLWGDPEFCKTVVAKLWIRIHKPVSGELRSI